MENKRIHFIGIGGVSQSKLALMLKSFGFNISGSDKEESVVTKSLRKQGIKIYIGHDKNNVQNCDVIVYNGAISDDNAEFSEAKKLNLNIVKRSVMLSQIAAMHEKCVAVCGCHGKTTTTSLLAYMLDEFKPQMHIGGDLHGKDFMVVEDKKLFVTEACEFQKSFLEIFPDVAVLLNIDEDHLDCYKDIDDIENTFLSFMNNIKCGGTLIYNANDFRCKRIAQKSGVKTVSFGTKSTCDVYSKNIKYSKQGISFNLFYKKNDVGKIHAKLYGMHNVLNVLAACAVSLILKSKNFLKEIEKFDGVNRRMEFMGNMKNNILIHDYAHHPAEISATIKAIKRHFKKPVIAVFEPHTYSRTKGLFNEFKQCFSDAKAVYILPIYSAREKPIAGVTSVILAASTPNATFVRGKTELKLNLEKHENSIILIMGAGGVVKLAKTLNEV